MPNLRIALGFTTESRRESAPVILAAGFDPAALQAAIDAAGPEYLRFETGTYVFARSARRQFGAPVVQPPSTPLQPMPAPGAGETHDNPAPGALPAKAAESGPEPEGGEAGDGDGTDDGPSLTLPKGRKPR